MAKNKKVKKVTKKAVQKTTKNELVIRVEQAPVVKESDLIPTKEAGKFMLAPSWLSEKQALKMLQRTDPKHIYRRKGKGNQEFDYVTGNYVTKVLNYTFGWNWDFEIVAHGKEGDQIWVNGKLTVKDNKGNSISKSQFGRADIKFKKDTAHTPQNMVDFGNDLKAATTDALKKCSSLLGIASDVYGKAEYKEINVEVVPDSVPVATEAPRVLLPSVPSTSKPEDYVCHGAGRGGCPNGADITKQEAEFSTKIYGKPLCRDCQKLAKSRK